MENSTRRWLLSSALLMVTACHHQRIPTVAKESGIEGMDSKSLHATVDGMIRSGIGENVISPADLRIPRRARRQKSYRLDW